MLSGPPYNEQRQCDEEPKGGQDLERLLCRCCRQKSRRCCSALAHPAPRFVPEQTYLKVRHTTIHIRGSTSDDCHGSPFCCYRPFPVNVADQAGSVERMVMAESAVLSSSARMTRRLVVHSSSWRTQ